jgi:hypothetical protein
MTKDNSTTPTPRVNSLNSIRDCTLELQRVYRQTRKGDLDTGTAKALTYILSVLVGMKRDSDIEERVTRLEENNGQSGKTYRAA